jgi:hypothetical protein
VAFQHKKCYKVINRGKAYEKSIISFFIFGPGGLQRQKARVVSQCALAKGWQCSGSA